MFRKVLIANRGEIALRILRALKEMNIHTVTVHSTADESAMHVQLADESVCIGPGPSKESYLNMTSILAAAEVTGADAIHPGVGFLSENAQFARMAEAHNLAFIGPSAEHIEVMGDKIRAKKAAADMGIPLVPGSNELSGDTADIKKVVDRIGYPLLIKAAHGGGGKGMRLVQRSDNFLKELEITRAEAMANFGSDSVYLERYLEKPKHIELQLLGDKHGNLVFLGERDCSIQRRHQKVWEEAPAPFLPRSLLDNLIKKIRPALQKMGYVGAGTLEFLYENNQFYFIEMNTRLQVEHPVTEMITGIDLVKEQIRIAAGEKLSFTQEDVTFKGHAIECRINAENPDTFLPTPGKIAAYLPPGGPHIRVDSALYQGYVIPPYYDSLVSKLVAYGETREQCLAHLKRALDEYVIAGPDTLIPLHKKLVTSQDVHEGQYHIHWLEEWLCQHEKAA